MPSKQDARRAADEKLDFRQSPVGFFNLGLSYIDAADALAKKHLDKDDPLVLAFESPIKHLYAHAWELCLKACVFQQGMKPSEMKYRLGHRLVSIWDRVDKTKFSELRLTPDTRHFVELIDRFHSTKLYAYPVIGIRHDFSITYVRGASQRFRISRASILRNFGASLHDPF